MNTCEFIALNLAVGDFTVKAEFISITPFMSAKKPSNTGPLFIYLFIHLISILFFKGLPETKFASVVEWWFQEWLGKLGFPLTKLAKLSILEGVNGIIKPGR